MNWNDLIATKMGRKLMPIVVAGLLLAACSGGGDGSVVSDGSNDPGSGDGTGGGGNQAPVAMVSATQPSGGGGDTVYLDGSDSYDPEGGAITYSWSQKSGPTVAISDASAASPEFIAPAPIGGESVVVTLTVADADGLSSSRDLTLALDPNAAQPAASTEGLIGAALDRGDIGAEEALTYKVFALFGDSRLPPAYTGTSDQHLSSRIMGDLAASYDSLSEAAKTQLYPYLLPAYMSGSWYDQSAIAQGAVLGAAATDPVWKSQTDGKVKIWYPSDLVNGDFLARGALASAQSTWAKLHELMGKEALSDAGQVPEAPPASASGEAAGGFDTGGELDIILVHQLGKGDNDPAMTVPYGKNCQGVPSFIQLRIGDLNDYFRAKLAHEMMHVWQNTYPLKGGNGACTSWNWVAESTAVWTEDFAYPDANTETGYAPGWMGSPSVPLDQTMEHDYGGYLWYSFLIGNKGNPGKVPPTVIRTIWEQAATMDSLQAVDTSSPPPIAGMPEYLTSLFQRYWGDFLVASFNQGPDGFFRKKDKTSEATVFQQNSPVIVKGTAGPDKMYLLEQVDENGALELPHLSGRTYLFRLEDQNMRSVYFYDGLRGKLDPMILDDGTVVEVAIPQPPAMVDPAPGATWRLMVKIGPTWKEWKKPSYMENLITKTRFCRDSQAERIDKLAIILANGSADPDNLVVPQGSLPPLLFLSNIGCWKWRAQVNVSWRDPYTGLQETTVTDMLLGGEVDPLGFPVEGLFTAKSAHSTTSISGGNQSCDENGCSGCTFNGNHSWDWSDYRRDYSLTTVPEAVSGTMYRQGQLGGGETVPVDMEYVKECSLTDKDGNQTSTRETLTMNPHAWVPTDSLSPISADGTRISGSTIYDDGEYRWELNSIRE